MKALLFRIAVVALQPMLLASCSSAIETHRQSENPGASIGGATGHFVGFIANNPNLCRYVDGYGNRYIDECGSIVAFGPELTVAGLTTYVRGTPVRLTSVPVGASIRDEAARLVGTTNANVHISFACGSECEDATLFLSKPGFQTAKVTIPLGSTDIVVNLESVDGKSSE